MASFLQACVSVDRFDRLCIENKASSVLILLETAYQKTAPFSVSLKDRTHSSMAVSKEVILATIDRLSRGVGVDVSQEPVCISFPPPSQGETYPERLRSVEAMERPSQLAPRAGHQQKTVHY